ncbi:hypothetical protein EYF80_008906 [Liparis tanakae]|uniref:Uncharacterized protein n=1 Tax=Liparis tanakae TaxID=230148 RepID=A0A4Z2ISU5_9TELE|nr:hypothetical protein EYF80_008906 [Liparis tanakae]
MCYLYRCSICSHRLRRLVHIVNTLDYMSAAANNSPIPNHTLALSCFTGPTLPIMCTSLRLMNGLIKLTFRSALCTYQSEKELHQKDMGHRQPRLTCTVHTADAPNSNNGFLLPW